MRQFSAKLFILASSSSVELLADVLCSRCRECVDAQHRVGFYSPVVELKRACNSSLAGCTTMGTISIQVRLVRLGVLIKGAPTEIRGLGLGQLRFNDSDTSMSSMSQ